VSRDPQHITVTGEKAMTPFLSSLNRTIAISLIGLAAVLTPTVGASQDSGLIQPRQQFDAANARGDWQTAIEYGRLALERAEQEFGETGEEIVGTLETLGEVSAHLNDFDNAKSYLQRAVAIKEQAYGPNHPDIVSTLESLVDISMQQANFDEAEELLKRILRIEQAAYGESHENVLITWNQLRDLYLQADRPADAAAVKTTLANLKLTSRSLDDRRYSTEDGFATVRVFYGTNRTPTGEVKASQYFGNERGELGVGYVDVSIPETHKYGELETSSRWSLYSYTLGEDALKKKYVLLLNVEELDQDSFRTQLQKHVGNSPNRDIFLFVHGYNSSFEDAARRAAQLAYDLDFDGTPMMYSWPSQASATSYTVDEAVVRVSGRKMASFLNDVLDQSGADRIHLIAHSMGNRALIEALVGIVAERKPIGTDPLFGQILFTAPDVDRDYFIDALKDIEGSADRITLYASNNDLALHSSAIMHGAPRAGLAGESLITAAGVDTIDMSGVKADRLGHTYFAANEGAIYDLFRMLWRGDPPERRCGMQQNDETWSFDADRCDGNELLEAGLLFKRFGPTAKERVQQQLDSIPEDDDDAKNEWSRILDRLNNLLETEPD
jgi:esterase/lipase superfamily enzyme